MKFIMSTPLLGFEDLKEVELHKIDDLFMKMQSTLNQNISFTLVNPYALREYSFEVPKNIQDMLQITKESNLLIFNIVLIQKPIENSYINFLAPIIFNTDTHMAAQIIIQDNPNYGIAETFADYLNKDTSL